MDFKDATDHMPETMHLYLRATVVATLSMCAACAAGPRGAAPAQPSGLGNNFIADSQVADSEIDWDFRAQRPVVDSVDRKVSALRTMEHRVPGDSSRMAIVVQWLPPYSLTDSLIVARRTLWPIEESGVSPSVRFRYRYDGPHVTGMIQRGDSAARQVDVTYDQPVFAFNQLDRLVRSLRYRPGLSVVVPLFSEMDVDLEHDTLTVVTDTVARGDRAWIVRFADPVIVRHYLVEAGSRQIVKSETRQRKSGLIFRQVRQAKSSD